MLGRQQRTLLTLLDKAAVSSFALSRVTTLDNGKLNQVQQGVSCSCNQGGADCCAAPSTSSASVSHAARRSMATLASLTPTGVPKPRAHVEEAMSTIEGGHIARKIMFTETMSDLQRVMAEYKESLTPLHLAVASRQLEKLFRTERGSALGLTLKSIACNIEELAAARAARLSTGQVASIVRGLTGSSHIMHPNSVLAIAAVLVAQDCQRLKLASDQDWKDVVWGFSMQGFTNTLFWQKISAEAVHHVGKWEANKVASVLKNFAHAGCIHAPFVQAAVARLAASAPQLTPLSIADSLYALVQLQQESKKGGVELTVDPEGVKALVAAGADSVGAMDGKTLGLFISSVARTEFGSAELAAKAAAAAKALPKDGLWSLYIAKLAQGCVDMGLQDAEFYGHLAERTTQQLSRTAPGVQALVLLALKRAPGADNQPAVVALEKGIVRQEAAAAKVGKA